MSNFHSLVKSFSQRPYIGTGCHSHCIRLAADTESVSVWMNVNEKMRFYFTGFITSINIDKKFMVSISSFRCFSIDCDNKALNYDPILKKKNGQKEAVCESGQHVSFIYPFPANWMLLGSCQQSAFFLLQNK